MFSTFISSESKMTASQLPREKFEPTEPLLAAAAVAGAAHVAAAVAGW